MIRYSHQIPFVTSITAESIPNLGWAVVGRMAKGTVNFNVLAVKEHCKGFETEAEAKQALADVRKERKRYCDRTRNR